MTQLVIEYRDNGRIANWWYEPDGGYEPNENEFVPDPEPDHRALPGKMVDTSSTQPELIEDPDVTWNRPGAVDSETAELIADQFRAAGADAIQAEQAGDAASFMRAVIQMEYLQYVALTGDRIEAVEDDYFPVG